MEIENLKIQGLKLIQMRIFRDNRGYFVERFNREKFAALGLPVEFAQDNYSLSLPGVLRGVHFQYSPPQGKLISCISGKIFDVAVDLRKNSPTFGQWHGVELSGENGLSFWIPAGFGHGFCVLGNEPAHVTYKVNCPWNAGGEGTLAFDDKSIGIRWPIENPILSDKDKVGMSFQDYQAGPLANQTWWEKTP